MQKVLFGSSQSFPNAPEKPEERVQFTATSYPRPHFTISPDTRHTRMLMVKNLALLACVATAITASRLDGATLEFRILINGIRAQTHIVPRGTTNTLRIEGRVLDNALPGGINGGIFTAEVNIDAVAQGVLEFEGEQGFIGSTGNWESTFNPDFGLQLKGVLDGNGYSVFGQTGAVKPGTYPSHVTTIGANGWSSLFAGQFICVGGATRLDVTSHTSRNLIASIDGSGGVYGRSPEMLFGESTQINIPEPATSVIGSFALLSVIAARRRQVLALATRGD